MTLSKTTIHSFEVMMMINMKISTFYAKELFSRFYALTKFDSKNEMMPIQKLFKLKIQR